MPYVYIIKSSRNNRYYIGSTIDLDRRLDEHNRGKTTATKHLAPWIVAFSQEFSDLTDARRIERKLKSFKNRKILDRIVATGTIEMKI